MITFTHFFNFFLKALCPAVEVVRSHIVCSALKAKLVSEETSHVITAFKLFDPPPAPRTDLHLSPVSSPLVLPIAYFNALLVLVSWPHAAEAPHVSALRTGQHSVGLIPRHYGFAVRALSTTLHLG